MNTTELVVEMRPKKFFDSLGRRFAIFQTSMDTTTHDKNVFFLIETVVLRWWEIITGNLVLTTELKT